MITLDSSAIIALFRHRDSNHAAALGAVRDSPSPLIVPAGALGEIAYILQQWAGGRELDAFLESIQAGDVLLDCGERDFPRIRELVSRYSNLPLGFADASVVACAERRGGRVLTYDLRHFGVVAGEGTIQVVGQS